jgi:hypothetical protein
MEEDKKAKVRELNDRLRSTFVGGKVLMTRGIADEAEAVINRVMKAVQSFDEFSEDNDPHEEHDFGAIDDDKLGKIFWKIDYYDSDMRMLSPDPSDPKVTNRVLTVMLASEY